MSVREVQVDQSREKVGLKRKLTGPPRLLLGKFRAKTQCDNESEAQTKGPNGRSDNMDPPKSRCSGTVGDSSSSIAMESFQNLASKQQEMKSEQTPAVALVMCPSVKRSEAEEDSHDDGSTVKGQPKKMSQRWPWAPSLVCIRRHRRKTGRERSVDGCCLHEKSSLTGEILVDDHIDPIKDHEATISHDQGQALPEGKSGFSSRTRSTLKRLITFNKRKKLKAAHSEPSVTSGSKNQIHPKGSFRKKMGLFFKRRNKNSPTSADHGGTRDKETVGPPLHGQGETSIPEGNCSEDTASGGHLIVSVEVSALGQRGTEERNRVESSKVADGSGSPVGLRMIAEEYKFRRCCKDELDRSDRRLKSDLPSKTAGSLPPLIEETPAAEKDLDWSPEIRANTHEDQLKESFARSPVDVTDAENDRVPEIVCTEGSMGLGHYLSRIALESSVQDTLALNVRVHNGVDCVGHLSRNTVPMDTDIVVTNGPMGSPLEDVPLGGRSLLNNLPYCESGPQNCEALLVQTASSLVQAAVQAALDQLAAELKSSTSAGVHQRAQAC